MGGGGMQKGHAERGGGRRRGGEKEGEGDRNRQVELFYRYLPYERRAEPGNRDQQDNRDTWTMAPLKHKADPQPSKVKALLGVFFHFHSGLFKLTCVSVCCAVHAKIENGGNLYLI